MHQMFAKKRTAVAVSAALLVSACGGGADSNTANSGTPAGNAWMNTSLAPAQRATLLVAAMTLADKEEQLVGTPGIVPELPNCLGSRHVNGLPKYQIPTLRITNGPVGVGQNDCVPLSVGSTFSALTNSGSAKATAVPSALATAASFDPAVATQFGNLIGTEGSNLALQVFEAPGMNQARLPVGGRNFEYMGEDPFLTGTMGSAEIQAVQSHGMIAMAKHFVANEQETNRAAIQENIDDKTLHEIYLLPFEMAVKNGQVGSVMCSYNSVNGFSMCENKHLLTDVLRGQWGFKGYVQSDFFAAHSTANTLLAGLENEMPGLNIAGTPYITWWTPANLNAALASGQIQTSDIDTALIRRYTQMFQAGLRTAAHANCDQRNRGRCDRQRDGRAIRRSVAEQRCAAFEQNRSERRRSRQGITGVRAAIGSWGEHGRYRRGGRRR